MGRAFFIKHRTSHLTIAVSDEVNGTRPTLTRPRHMRVRRVTPPAPAAPAPAASRRPRAAAGAGRGQRRATRKEKA
jgi:hypothetical protein